MLTFFIFRLYKRLMIAQDICRSSHGRDSSCIVFRVSAMATGVALSDLVRSMSILG